jgi:hypothetical protein
MSLYGFKWILLGIVAGSFIASQIALASPYRLHFTWLGGILGSIVGFGCLLLRMLMTNKIRSKESQQNAKKENRSESDTAMDDSNGHH